MTGGFQVAPRVWTGAGKGVTEASDVLAAGVDAFCRALGGGQPFGNDDLGRMAFLGDPAAGAPGFKGLRDGLLKDLVAAVNLLRGMGAGLVVAGGRYIEADGTIVDGLGGQRTVEPVPRPGVQDLREYVLPPVPGGLAMTAPPPAVWVQALWVLEAVGAGCAWPDGDVGGVRALRDAAVAMGRVVAEVLEEVVGHAGAVTGSGYGQATEAFGSAARVVHGEGGLLADLMARCEGLARYCDQSIDAIGASQRQCVLSAVFVLVLLRFGAVLGVWAEALVVPLIRLEGAALRIVLRVIREALLGAVFSGGLTVIGQLVHGEGLKLGELLKALGHGALAGGLMGGAHAGLLVLRGWSPAMTRLIQWMESPGARGYGSRFVVGGGVGTTAMATAGWMAGDGWDWKHAAETGFGMALIGVGGEVAGRAYRKSAFPHPATGATGSRPSEQSATATTNSHQAINRRRNGDEGGDASTTRPHKADTAPDTDRGIAPDIAPDTAQETQTGQPRHDQEGAAEHAAHGPRPIADPPLHHFGRDGAETGSHGERPPAASHEPAAPHAESPAAPPAEGGVRPAPELTPRHRELISQFRHEVMAGIWYRDPAAHVMPTADPRLLFGTADGIDVAIAGDGTHFLIGEHRLTARDLGTMLVHDPRLISNPDAVLRVLGGETAKNPLLLQELADVTGRQVLASDHVVYIGADRQPHAADVQGHTPDGRPIFSDRDDVGWHWAVPESPVAQPEHPVQVGVAWPKLEGGLSPDLVQAAVAAHDSQWRGLGEGADGLVEVLTVDDGRIVARKTIWGDSKLTCSELLGALVGRQIEANVADVQRYPGRHDVVLMEYVDGRMVEYRFGANGQMTPEPNAGSKPGAVLIDLLDVLTVHHDRPGNLMLTDDGLVAIDHGRMFDTRNGRSEIGLHEGLLLGDNFLGRRPDGQFGWIDNPLTRQDVELLTERLHLLRNEFDHYGMEAEFEVMMDRLYHVGQHAKGDVSLIARDPGPTGGNGHRSG
ncbi:hypothetical protein [Streptosporangium sp. NPDC000396]|uniref:WXG100-like domain-containing protein n=1 Tax=Streptosporangium sp. NPDC000396 TaxID=3366185 RepID=UPI00369D0673